MFPIEEQLNWSRHVSLTPCLRCRPQSGGQPHDQTQLHKLYCAQYDSPSVPNLAVSSNRLLQEKQHLLPPADPTRARSRSSRVWYEFAAPRELAGREGSLMGINRYQERGRPHRPWCRARNHSHRSRAGYWFGPIGNLGKGAGHRYLRHEAIGCFPPRYARNQPTIG